MTELKIMCVNQDGYSYDYLSEFTRDVLDISKQYEMFTSKDIYTYIRPNLPRDYVKQKTSYSLSVLAERGFIRKVFTGNNRTIYYEPVNIIWIYKVVEY